METAITLLGFLQTFFEKGIFSSKKWPTAHSPNTKGQVTPELSTNKTVSRQLRVNTPTGWKTASESTPWPSLPAYVQLPQTRLCRPSWSWPLMSAVLMDQTLPPHTHWIMGNQRTNKKKGTAIAALLTQGEVGFCRIVSVYGITQTKKPKTTGSIKFVLWMWSSSCDCVW